MPSCEVLSSLSGSRPKMIQIFYTILGFNTVGKLCPKPGFFHLLRFSAGLPRHPGTEWPNGEAVKHVFSCSAISARSSPRICPRPVFAPLQLSADRYAASPPSRVQYQLRLLGRIHPSPIEIQRREGRVPTLLPLGSRLAESEGVHFWPVCQMPTIHRPLVTRWSGMPVQ